MEAISILIFIGVMWLLWGRVDLGPTAEDRRREARDSDRRWDNYMKGLIDSPHKPKRKAK